MRRGSFQKIHNSYFLLQLVLSRCLVDSLKTKSLYSEEPEPASKESHSGFGWLKQASDMPLICFTRSSDRPGQACKSRVPASERTDTGSERPVPACERSDQCSDRLDPASEKPEPALGGYGRVDCLTDVEIPPV